MKANHSSKEQLKNLSTTRNLNKKGILSHSSNLKNTLFGPKKNVVMTYSKSRPIHLVKKNHFHTPDTPKVLTPDELQTTEENQDTGNKETMRDGYSKCLNPVSQGGSYTSGKMLQSLDGSSLQMANKLGKSTKNDDSSVKSISLVLRNISNIPIEKTLSRTPCTRERNDAQRVFQDKSPKSTSTKSIRKTPISLKRRNNLIKKTQECKKSNGQDDNVEKYEDTVKKGTQKNSTDNKTRSLQSDNLTNYSVKSMSTCTTAGSFRGTSQQASHKFTGQSMSLCQIILTKYDQNPVTNYSPKSMSTCTTAGSSTGTSKQASHMLTGQSKSLCHDESRKSSQNIEQNPVALECIDNQALLPINSTFNKSDEKVTVQEFFPSYLSPVKDRNIEQKDSPPVKLGESLKEDIISHSDKKSERNQTQIPGEKLMKNDSYVSQHNEPKTSTPTDQGKLPAALEVCVSPILETSNSLKSKSNQDEINTQDKGVKENVLNASQRNSSTRINRNEPARSEHKAIKTTKRQVQDKEESSKTSLPLQASICIEDDSDPEQIPDNITPEIMETNKSCPLSSKRKLEYGLVLNRPDRNVCFLLDFKCTKKKPCKIWMKKGSLIGSDSKVCVAQDVLAVI